MERKRQPQFPGSRAPRQGGEARSGPDYSKNSRQSAAVPTSPTDRQQDFPDRPGNWALEPASVRIRAAVRLGGGLQAVAARSGIPDSTISSWQTGGDVKLSRLVALADATGVRAEWLATGRGPMTVSEERKRELEEQRRIEEEIGARVAAELARAKAEQPATPSAPSAHAIAPQIDADRLALAYSVVLKALTARGQLHPDPRRLMLATIGLYDHLTAAEEASRGGTHPQDDPQAFPQESPSESAKAD